MESRKKLKCADGLENLNYNSNLIWSEYGDKQPDAIKRFVDSSIRKMGLKYHFNFDPGVEEEAKIAVYGYAVLYTSMHTDMSGC